MIALDMRTVMFANVVINSVSLIVLLTLWHQNRNKYSGLFYFVSDLALQLSGLLLIALRGVIPDWVSIVVSNGMVVGGNMILYFGLRRFTGNKNPPILFYSVLAVFALFIFIHSYFTFINYQLTVRNINTALGLSLVSSMSTWLMFTSVSPEIRRISTGTGISSAIIVLISLARAGGFLLNPDTTGDFLKSGMFDTLMVLLFSGATAYLVFNLVLMVNRRLFIESKQMEQTLADSEVRYRCLFETAQDAILILDGDTGQIIDANPFIKDLLGYSMDELKGKNLREIGELKDTLASKISYKQLHESGYVRYEHLPLVTRDGRPIAVVVVANAYLVDHTRIIQCNIRDVTERKKIEEELRESEEYNKSILENSPNPVLIINPDFSIRYINPAGENLTGYPISEIFDKKPPYPWWPEGSEEEYLDGFKETMTGVNTVYERNFKKKNGEPLWVEISLSAVIEDGELKYYLSNWVDITVRKKIEKALSESEKTFRELANLLPQTVCQIDAKGKVTFVNINALDMFGLSIKDLEVGITIWQMIEPEDRDRAMADFQKILNGEQLSNTEYMAQRKDGSTFPILAYYSHPVFDRDNPETVSSLNMVIVDISRRKQAEEELKQSEQRFRNLIENLPVGLVITDLDGQVLMVNKALLEMRGFDSEEEIMRLPASERYYDIKDRGHFLSLIQEGPVKDFEVRQKRQDGSFIWVSSSAIPFTTASGENQFINVHLDITNRKTAETALKLSEERFRNLIENIPLGISITSPDGQTIMVNKGYLKLRGYDSLDDVQRIPAPERYYDPKDRERWLALIKEKDAVQDFEVQLKHKDGTVFWASSNAVRLISDSGEQLLSVTQDITERKRAEGDRQRTEKLESIGTLAGGIAHDFNNILTGILGNIQLTAGYLKQNKPDIAGEMLAEAEKASFRARDLTHQLLTFSRGGAPVKKVMLINTLIKESATFALRGSNVRPEFAIADKLWAAEVDEGQLNQVINNLVINANQAMPNGGVINVRARNIDKKKDLKVSLPEGDYIEIEVEDHGTGIPEDHKSRIFEPYFTTKGKGSGLGLATSYSIIKNHGGIITFDSKLGAGTTFRVYLPATREKVNREKTRPEALTQPMPAIQGRILVMDDEDIIRMLLGRMLAGAGYEVEQSKDGEEAVRKYTEAKQSGKPFDAVILDLTVPGGMGGREVIERLLEIEPEVKAIVSSGYANDPIMADYKKYGFSGVVTKPYDIEQMQKTLHDVLVDK